MNRKQGRRGEHLYFFFACIMITPILMCGCSHVLLRPAFKEANDLSNRGNYKASLYKYEQIIEQYPMAGDRVLFAMGVIYAYPMNQQKDYQKSLECFQKLIKDYPGSEYRQDSELMISLINDVTSKDKRIETLERQVGFERSDITSKARRIITQQKKIEALEREVGELEKKIEGMKDVDMSSKRKKKFLPEKK